MADIVLTGNTSGAITVAAPAVAGTNTLTLPASTSTIATTADVNALTTGKILQVVQTTKTDTFSTTTAIPSFTNITGVSATITPSATDSKILVMVSGGISNSSSGYTGGVNLLRDSTSIYLGDTRGSATRSSAWALTKTSGRCNMFSITYVDSPSTTSAITYYLQAGTESGGTIIIGGTSASGGSYNGSFPTNLVLMEVSA
jgi:hypothetical protein